MDTNRRIDFKDLKERTKGGFPAVLAHYGLAPIGSGDQVRVIRNPADQCVGELGGVTAGHQAKWVAALITSGLSARVRQRSLNAAPRPLSRAKCSFATASSASGQRCSAGCSSGV